MGKPGPRQAISFTIDETYFMEWVNRGFDALAQFLACHRAFDAWLDEHHRKEPA